MAGFGIVDGPGCARFGSLTSAKRAGGPEPNGILIGTAPAKRKHLECSHLSSLTKTTQNVLHGVGLQQGSESSFRSLLRKTVQNVPLVSRVARPIARTPAISIWGGWPALSVPKAGDIVRTGASSRSPSVSTITLATICRHYCCLRFGIRHSPLRLQEKLSG